MAGKVKYGMMLVLLLCGGGAAHATGDTIPLQAVQTASRTVELSWTPATAGVPCVLYRRYPGESESRQIATTSADHFTDHHDHAVCDDTVHYSIVQTAGAATHEGTAAVSVSDLEATSPATWGVVTVDERSEHVVLEWEASPDTDIMGYLICEGTPSMAIDTVFGRETTEYVPMDYTVEEVHHFRICAFDSCRQASPLTEMCNNMRVEVSSEACSREVTALWNSYLNMPGDVDHYEVWASEDGGPEREVARVPYYSVTTASFEVGEGTMRVRVYIKAVGGSYISRSNVQELVFATAERPGYFYLRKVTSADDGSVVTVVAQTDAAFSSEGYRVYRSVDGGPGEVVGRCQPTGDGTLTWQDFAARPQERVSTYWIGVMDGCGRNEMTTQKGSTLTVRIAEQGEEVDVSWNGYEGWTGTTGYELFSRPIDGGEWTVEGSTTGQEVRNAGGDGPRQYKVVATEGGNSEWRRNDSLQSAVFYHRPMTQLWLPNAFTPLETSNNRFGPVFAFMNREGYRFTVFNRAGLVVFSSDDPTEQWDGRWHGRLQPQGTYVYKVAYRQSDGTDQEKIGTVLLIQ